MHFSVVSAILFAVSASALEYARPEAPLAYARPSVSTLPTTLPEYTEEVKPTPTAEYTETAEPTATAEYTEAAEPTAPADYTETVAGDYPRSYANGYIEDNGSSGDIFNIKDIILTPSVPVAGQPLDIHLIGKLRKVVDQGSRVFVKAQYEGATIIDVELDACEVAKHRKFTHQCPAQPEDFDVHHTLKIPRGSPKGNYVINSYGLNQDKARIFNVTIFHKNTGSAYY